MSEVQFENIFYSSPLPIFILQGDYYQLVNSRMAQITGYTTEELLSMPFYEIIHSGDRARVTENARRRLAGEAVPKGYEFRAVDRLGDIIYLTGFFSLIEFNGRMSILGQLVVVTEQKLAKKALRDSEEKYRTILENIVDGYFEVDVKGNFTFFNESISEITGYGKKEMEGMGYTCYTTPADAEKVFHAFNDVFRTGESAKVFDWEIIRKDGARRFIEASISLITDNEGNRTGFRGVVRDITDRRRAEEQFRLQKAYFQNLFEGSPEGIAILDSEDRIINVNRAFENLFLYPAGEIVGRLINDIIIPEGLSEEAWAYTHKTWSGQIVTGETVRKRKDGSLVDVALVGYPMVINDRQSGLYGIYSDITQRKKTEEALQGALEKLRGMETIVNKSPVIVFRWLADIDRGWPVEFVSGNIMHLGYTPEELTSGEIPYSKIIHDDDLERVKAEVTRYYIEGVNEFNQEYRVVTKTGETLWVEDRAWSLRSMDGTITHYQGIVIDITARKDAEDALRTINQDLEAANEELVAAEEELTQRLQELQESEQALRESEEKYRMLFHNVNDGIVMVDISGEMPGRIIEVNEVLCNRYGYARDEILASTPMDFCTAEQQHKIPSIIKEIKAREHVTFEMNLIAGNGQEIPFEISGHIYEMDDEKVGLLVVRDITERKRTEDQLKFLSLHDSLTGLFNRAYFEQEMQRLEGSRCVPVSIIVFDVDGLKLVNDTMGHDKGDQLLKATAVIIRESFRSGDVVSRIGGDEFAVLLPSSGREVLEKAIQRIRDGFADHNAVKPELMLSVSLGFATSNNETVNMGNLFREADNNMYREKLHRSKSTRSAIVQTLMKALRARDFITEGHADRLQDMVASLSLEMGLTERNVTDLRLLAQFHDIGKVGIPDRILFKPGPLTPDEVVEMQRHSEIGHRIAQSSPDLVPIADWILAHHEWWNGNGYPLGRKGEEIPLECRILAIADAYDAMTSDRPYRKAMSQAEAVAELKRCSDTQFDPVLVQKFINMLVNKELAESIDIG